MVEPTVHRPQLLIAMPGPASRWLSDAVVIFCQLIDGNAMRRIDAGYAFASDDPVPRVYVTTSPGPGAIKAIEERRLDVVVAIEDVVDSVEWSMRFYKWSLGEALRRHTAWAVANPVIAADPGARVLTAPSGRTAGSVLRALAGAFELPCDERRVQFVLKRLALGEDQPFEEAVRSYGTSSSEEAVPAIPAEEGRERLIRNALEPMVDLLRGIYQRPIVWPRELLLSADLLDQSAPRIVRLIGPSRNLVYGPYFYLPAGSYSGEVVLALSGRIHEMTFLLEFHAASCLAQARLAPKAPGAYRASLDFRHEHPREPVEMRLRSERGAIEGELAFVELRLWPRAPAPGTSGR